MSTNERALLFALSDYDELRSVERGNDDLKRIKRATGYSVERIARIVGVSSHAMSSTSDSPRVKDGLRRLVRVVSIGRETIGVIETRRWWTEPMPLLGGMSPTIMMEDGRAVELLAMVEAVLDGTDD